jgi:hypothetical protein
MIMPDMLSMNLLNLYDTLTRPYYTSEKKFQFYSFTYGGIFTRQFGSHGSVSNPLRIWEPEQLALEMLQGYNPCTAIAKKSAQIDASDNGRRGHICFDGTFRILFSFGAAWRFFVHNNWSIGVYIPSYVMRLSHVKTHDLTESITDEDLRTKEFLTNPWVLPQETCALGDLDIGGWQRGGLGDIVTQAEWYQDFIQQRPILRNVRLNWRIGVGIPTARRVDENKLIAISFGRDGAWSIPLGIGLDFTVGSWFRTGVDVQLTFIFGNKRHRRIKTYPTQTDLLLLTKLDAYKDFGLEQQYNLYVEFFSRNLSFKCGYQYITQGDDELSFGNNNFSPNIANLLVKLHDRTMHEIILVGWYDMKDLIKSSTEVKIGMFSQLPFNGRRSFAQQTLSLMVAVNF